MADRTESPPMSSNSPSRLSAEINSNGSLRRLTCGAVMINLFLGNELEGGPTNLYLRRLDRGPDIVPLLGPRSPTRFRIDHDAQALVGTGAHLGVRYSVVLGLARAEAAWFWHVALENSTDAAIDVDLIYAQDVALAPYDAVRLNEYYVSQYVDHTPLQHATRGWAVASRQNLAVGGSHPWCLMGSLRKAVSFATDALQVHGLANRSGDSSAQLTQALPGVRLQHEHSMVALQDEPLHLGAGAKGNAGFFGLFLADHPSATLDIDLERVEQALALPEAAPSSSEVPAAAARVAPSLFASAALLESHDLDQGDIVALFGADRRHEERDERGRCLSFFHGSDRHVVLRAKELRVLRPHGHLLRTGRHLVPDETALTSTTWMNGVFHSMLTQGHVSFNRFLSTVHGYLGLFHSHGLRAFVELGNQWHLLDVPSAYEMTPAACRWVYKHAGGRIEVRSRAQHPPHGLDLEIEVADGPAARFLIAHHVALNGDDGSSIGAALWAQDGDGIAVRSVASSDIGRRFPDGRFVIVPSAGTVLERIGGDELLFADGRSRQQPFVCLITAATRSVGLQIRGQLIASVGAAPAVPDGAVGSATFALQRIDAPESSPSAAHLARLAEILPWFEHNALVHYLSPRGLEQYSGGGWGTRDVTQGPVELLLAQGRIAPIRDLLLRVMSAQAPDGDWPQWFMFFERERGIRAGDSHGDIVFWPVLALAQYLIASGDAAVLDERVPFFESETAAAARFTVWEHVERALRVIEERVIGGTALAAYGHGDWNDALQPADPAMRRYMCSAWTVTLHYQTLTTLAQALRTIGRESIAERLDRWAESIRRDFQKLLVIDDVLTGYVLFEPEGAVRYLLHPRDAVTGVRYSALGMIHAILEGLFTPVQARAHLQLLKTVLSGPDGVRLFDRPLAYHGGPQRYFQRAESATFFGREIGLMYMHAHLRYAQALAFVGDAEQFFHALCQANPIGLRELVPTAALRQSNCYYSSSDAAFRDRYQASDEYERVAHGRIELHGGWRVYSSGAGIAFGLVLRRFLGWSLESDAISVDPVVPKALNGMRVQIELFGRPVTVFYDIESVGHGVNGVTVNGASLPFVRASNPYRRGAARVPTQLLVERLTTDDNEVRINVG